jgi:hypothetical protein
VAERLTREQQIAITKACLVTFATARSIPLDEVTEEWTERAAIREYLGDMRHRRNAELHALGDTFASFTQRGK